MQSSSHRLSQSPLWQWQRNYFAKQGVQAWAKNVVPDFVTNNSFTAAAFARLVLARMKDYVRHCEGAPDTVYILEAGAGSGRFAHRLLHFLHQVAEPPCSFVYVLTDFAPSILDFWRENPRLQRYIDLGSLDFARYDADSTAPLRLEHSEVVLSPGSLRSPLIVIGNYYFDSLPHDLFQMKDGTLYSGMVEFSEPEEGGATGLDNVLQTVNYLPQDGPAYDREDWQSVVRMYQEELPDGTFTFPVGGLQSLDFLSSLSEQGAFMIAADKGPNLMSGLQSGRHDEIDKHGAVSVSVNFHAFLRLAKQAGGATFQLSFPYHRINVAAWQSGPSPELTTTRTVFQREIANFGPDDFANLKDLSLSKGDAITAQELFSFLRLSNWDPEMILSFYTRLVRLLPTQSPSVRKAYIQGFRDSLDLHYPLDESIRYQFLLGGLCAQVAEFQDALRFYVGSMQMEGEAPDTVFNGALCLARLGASDESRAWLARAEALGVSIEETDLVRAELD